MATVPVLPMQIRQGFNNGIEYRLIQFAEPESGTWIYYVQTRAQGAAAWGDAVELEVAA